MIKKILTTILFLLIVTPQVFAVGLPPEYTNERFSAKKPKPAFLKSNRINLFYQKKEYRGLLDKYKNFSVGVMEVKDERMSKFYRKKDNFFQTKLIPTLQVLIKEELEQSNMFKEVKMVYEPLEGEMTPGKMNRIQQNYNVDMIMLVNLTDFQVIRGMSEMHAKMLIQGEKNVISPATLDGMDMKFKVGGIFQLVFLPLNYVVWSDTVAREFLEFAPKGKLKSKEHMEPILQGLLSSVMTDMLYLISEDGKLIKTR